VIRTDDFAGKFSRVRYFHEPFNSYIKELKGDRPVSHFVLADPPAAAVVYSDGFFKVIDLRALSGIASAEGAGLLPTGPKSGGS